MNFNTGQNAIFENMHFSLRQINSVKINPKFDLFMKASFFVGSIAGGIFVVARVKKLQKNLENQGDPTANRRLGWESD